MDYLSNVRFDKALRVKEGVFVHNYKELLTELRVLNDEEFRTQFDKGLKIIEWIRENQKDERLLMKLEIAKRKREYIRILEKRIKQLTPCKSAPEKRTMPPFLNIVFFTVFAMVIFAFLYYVFENDGDSMKKTFDENAELKSQVEQYAERISSLETQNLKLMQELNSKQMLIFPAEMAVPSARDRVKREDIRVYGDSVLISVNNAFLAEFADTGSMLPLLSSEATGIEIIPRNGSEIYPGDVISYKLQDRTVIIHRVIEVGEDDDGWYAYTKGDNNPFRDRDKVRFSQVEMVLVGVIY